MLMTGVLLFELILGFLCYEESFIVQTPLGKIQGQYKKAFGGRRYAAFEGIPFAKPPIGERRFEEPEPIKPWYGIWNATHSTVCAQATTFPYTKITGEEDCLYINVYVPKSVKNLDVIVYIHGGSFMYGSGYEYSQPDFLMDHDIIYVTFNYRLGIFGFLSTEDHVVPGNNGLKDQVLALKWVQNNIASFGGNPNSVTLTGSSAGATSVHLHYLSDGSKSLFHRGYSQSGVSLNPYTIQEKPLLKTKKLAAAVGCPTDSTRNLVDCLKQRPYVHLLNQLNIFFVYKHLPIVPFGPVVEKAGSKPFLKTNPYNFFKQKRVYDVPWITSLTSHEGFLFAATQCVDDLNYIDKNWDYLAPAFLEFNDTLPTFLHKKTAQKIKQFYLGDQKINKNTIMEFGQIFTDRIFANGAQKSIMLQAKVNKSPVYFFIFGYFGDNKEKFVSHGADEKFVFNSFHNASLSPNDIKMKDKLVKMLISYAKTGKPVFENIEWKPVNRDKVVYLALNVVEPNEIKLTTDKELTNITFWNSLNFLEDENLVYAKDEL